MKRLSLWLLALLLIPFLGMGSPVSALMYERRNERELLLFWQDGMAHCSGLHRPYSAVQLSAGDEVVWEGNTDGRGAFECTLPPGKVDPQQTEKFTLRAFDQFGAEIHTASGAIDELASILPSQSDLSITGTPSAESTELVSSQGPENEANVTEAELHPAAPEVLESEGLPLFVIIMLSISGAGGLVLGVFFLWKKYHVVS